MSEIQQMVPSVETREELKLNRAAVVMLVTAFLTMMFGPFLYWALAMRLDTLFAMFLLVAPSVLIVFGAIRLLTIQQKPELLTLGTAAFDVVKNLLVTAYVCCGFLHPTTMRSMRHLLSIVSLITACVLVGLVYRLTSWIMNAPTDQREKPLVPLTKWRKDVIDQLLQHRFLSICGLLVACLHVTLFLALSVAFHDRAVGGVSFERQGHRNDLPGTAEGGSSEHQTVAVPIRTLAFPFGSTSLQCTETASSRKFGPEFYDQSTVHGFRVDQLKQADLPDDCTGELSETAWNAWEMYKLKADLTTIYARSAFDRYRVAVVAHATDSKPNSGFASNYEMSRARAEQVQALVETIFAKLRDEDPRRPPLNVEWQIMPAGTGNMYLSAAASPTARSLTTAGLKRELTTEVQLTRIPDHLTKLQRDVIERQNGHGATPELQLLDYLYFTITNAAGSDLAPASSFVQFVSAAGHIFQLFLLVVAFNVILAFRRPTLPEDQHA
jgi:hypothetical protein